MNNSLLANDERIGKQIVRVREITPADYPALEDFLYYAIFVPPGVEQPPRDIIKHPDVLIYIDGFGGRRGDCGVVAEADGYVVGAAWERIIPAFGHIDDDTPELAISVLPECRGRAIGTMMMARLFELLFERGYKQTSLAVQKKNAAVRFYQRLGYKAVRESEEEFIMIKDLRVKLK
jgi:ribosomal protein S18 acetylase RimI-like enzyme